MKNYKVIFAHKDIIYCRPTESNFAPNRDDNIFVEENKEKNRLIYAIVKSASEMDAITIARKIADDYYKD